MKEKILEILQEREYYNELYRPFLPAIAEQFEPLINQEVEKRIAETVAGKFIAVEIEKRIADRFPSEEEMDAEVDERFPNIENPHIFGKQLGFGDCYFWLRSRLTCSEKPNNSQKTEGGEG